LGIGVVLSQKHHPIAFFSKKTLSMKKQSAYAREFYAIIESLPSLDTIYLVISSPLGLIKKFKEFNQSSYSNS